jgi:hypothetical protein
MLKAYLSTWELAKNIVFRNNKNITAIMNWILGLPQKSLSAHQVRKLTNQLQSHDLQVNLAAIDELEKMSTSCPQYHWLIMESLTNFVRNCTSYSYPEAVINNSLLPHNTVITAVMTVIGRRDTSQEPENQHLDLSYADLSGLNLQELNLQRLNLYQANLSGANLAGTDLQESILTAANLSDSNLKFANLQGVILSAANLKGANLYGANLHRANLYLARLQGAVLDAANVQGANFREAKFSN